MLPNKDLHGSLQVPSCMSALMVDGLFLGPPIYHRVVPWALVRGPFYSGGVCSMGSCFVCSIYLVCIGGPDWGPIFRAHRETLGNPRQTLLEETNLESQCPTIMDYALSIKLWAILVEYSNRFILLINVPSPN